MKLSNLQKYIVKKVFNSGGKKISRDIFLEFYKSKKITPKKEMQVKIVTQSLERLIDKGLIVGFGHKTKEKYFIEIVKLTPFGRKQGRALLGKQVSLPFRSKKGK